VFENGTSLKGFSKKSFDQSMAKVCDLTLLEL